MSSREHEHGEQRVHRLRGPASAGRQGMEWLSALGNRGVQRLLGGSLQRLSSEAATVDEPIAAEIQARRGTGGMLGAGVRGELESALGDDFSDVRIHTDGGADRLAQAVGAEAFTTGTDIFFRSGRYDPDSGQGRKLIAHEVTHVVQQRGAAPASELRITDPGDAAEVEASAVAEAIAGSAVETASRRTENEESED